MAVSSAEALPSPDLADSVAASLVLPSAQLARLAELAAAEAAGAGDAQGLSEQALADVLAAVDASTAANTKAVVFHDKRHLSATLNGTFWRNIQRVGLPQAA